MTDSTTSGAATPTTTTATATAGGNVARPLAAATSPDHKALLGVLDEYLGSIPSLKALIDIVSRARLFLREEEK